MRHRLQPTLLLRHVLLPTLLLGAVVMGALIALAVAAQPPDRPRDALAGASPDDIARRLAVELEGIPSPADVRRAERLTRDERRRQLAAHPYFQLYKIAKRRFGVPWFLVASIHYQETGFGPAPASLARRAMWRRHRLASADVARPPRYAHRARRHPSARDPFDLVMAIGAALRAAGVRDLGAGAARAASALYGSDDSGRLSGAMVLERARAWKQLRSIPLPGRGELARPVNGVVGGCGYFHCPRPGHLHNGVDFLAPSGTPVHAAEAGRVALVESPGESGGYGNFLCVQHRPHLATCYAHLSAFAAGMRVGRRVTRGQVIGLVGNTGVSFGSHLHFEVRRGPAACQTCAVDPLPYLSSEVPRATLGDLLPELRSGGPPAPAPARPPVSGGAGAPTRPPAASRPPRVVTTEDPAPDPISGRRPPRPAAPVPPPRAPVVAPAPHAPAPSQPAPAPAPDPTPTPTTTTQPATTTTTPPPADPEPGEPAPPTEDSGAGGGE